MHSAENSGLPPEAGVWCTGFKSGSAVPEGPRSPPNCHEPRGRPQAARHRSPGAAPLTETILFPGSGLHRLAGYKRRAHGPPSTSRLKRCCGAGDPNSCPLAQEGAHRLERCSEAASAVRSPDRDTLCSPNLNLPLRPLLGQIKTRDQTVPRTVYCLTKQRRPAGPIGA